MPSPEPHSLAAMGHPTPGKPRRSPRAGRGWRQGARFWLAFWRSGRQRRPRTSRRAEREFLPAVLELQETPPSPTGRLLLWAILVLFTGAVVWAYLGEIDVVATARGKVVPSGRVKVIQPLSTGVIRAIHVHEGQAVQAGDRLIELDPTETRADETRLEKELAAARLDLARLMVLTETLSAPEGVAPGTWLGTAAAGSAGPSSADGALVVSDVAGDTVELSPVQRRILAGQRAELRARLAALDHQVAEREAARQAAEATVTKLERTLPLITRRVESLKRLADQGMGATAEWLALEQERVEQAQDLRIHQARVRELEAAIGRTREQRAAMEAEFIRERFEERAEAERRAQSLVEELTKARQRTRLQRLTAPVAGVVQQLAVHTTGGVVTPAQILMHIVPRDDRLEVEAWLPNKDIGFVTEGQEAEVKVETFSFTRYGTLVAEIVDVSDDAVADEAMGLVYKVRALLAESVMNVAGKPVNLTPGMAVTLEVKTGTRQVLEFVLSPLLRGLSESGRER